MRLNARKALTDDRLMMLPARPWAMQSLAKRWMAKNGNRRFTARVRWYSCSLKCRNGVRETNAGPFTSTSRPPSAS
ncbi:hypothetical protein D3C79_779200 [compost metagenome]